MANRYANLTPSVPINQDFQKVTQGFDRVQDEIDTLNDLDNKVDEILKGQDLDPNKDPEVMAGRVSSEYGFFETLPERLDNTDQVVKSHTAETVSQVITFTRDLTLAGTQTINTLDSKDIKAIILFGSVHASNKKIKGLITKVSQRYHYVDGTSKFGYSAVGDIGYFSESNLTNRTSIVVNNYQKGSFDIVWSIANGTGATGTARIDVLVFYHGE